VPRRAFRDYLAESLEQIERHAPDVYALLGQSLGERSVRIEVGGESLSLRIQNGNVAIDATPTAAAIETRTTRAAIVAIAGGEATLEQAVLDERVHIRASVDDLAAGMDALAVYLNGAARCPELLGLMDAFRGDAAGGGLP
jgi:hypothetical protein